MSSPTHAASTFHRATRPDFRAASPLALALALAGVILLGCAKGAAAADASGQKPRWEFLVASGSLVPTAGQRDVFERADLTAAQLSYVLRPDLAITTTLGWARSRDTASAGKPKLDIFTYDLGAEFRPSPLLVGETTTFSTFAGVGLGGRSYNYRSLDVDAVHNVAGYVSAGGEVGVKRIRVRLEVRDYLAGFKPLDGNGGGGARSNVVTILGLRYVRKSP